MEQSIYMYEWAHDQLGKKKRKLRLNKKRQNRESIVTYSVFLSAK